MRRAFLTLAVLNFAIVGWAIYDETVTRRPWKAVQAAWNARLAARGLPVEPVGIREFSVPALDLHDRCTTCHLAVDRDGFGDGEPRQFRMHPRRKEILGPHPPERFGCTPCHQGQGAQTKGIARATFDHGRDDPYWERPLLDGEFIQSTCLDCHEAPPRGAETWTRGRQLFEELRCHGCHLAAHFEPPRGMPAPSLALIREKTSQSFVEAWLRDARAIRPGAQMPAFWRNEPSSGEPAAIAAYLASLRPPRTLPEVSFSIADPARIAAGRALFDRVGCRGCHAIGDVENPPPEARFGPDLTAIGEKATARWIAAWLLSPSSIWADARMPDLRLRDEEIQSLTAFLSSVRRPGRAAARSDWNAPDPSQVEAGRSAILRLGCTGCHEIPGIPREGRPGPDLDSFGDRVPEELYFGDAPVDCGRRSALPCFAVEKVRAPRRFSGRAVPAPVMPEYVLSDEDARALAVFVTAGRERHVPASYRRPSTGHERAIEAGERVIRRRNCRGCHETGRNEGGWIRRHSEPGLSPPTLAAAGRKFQYPWLWDFLRAPRTIRPYLDARMPSFGLGDDEIEAIAAGFAARDGQKYPVERIEPPRLDEAARVEAQSLFAKLRCRQCHPASPDEKSEVKSRAELAPDLTLAPSRLKPAWVRAWLEDPQLLQPDTKMPTFFAPLDEDRPDDRAGYPGFFDGAAARQIEALVGLVCAPARP